jgi:hypothetical protein
MTEPEGPISAGEVEVTTDKDRDELAREAARSRVAARKARADALRKTGALPPPSSDVAARIEHGLQQRLGRQSSEFRKRKSVVASKLDQKRGQD